MTAAEQQEVTCSRCGRTAVPSFHFDYYADAKSDDSDAMMCERCMMQEAFASTSPTGGELSPIPADYEKNVCQVGQGATTCAFLGVSEGFKCTKGTTTELTIKARLEEGSMGAQGDNCSGPPDFTPTP